MPKMTKAQAARGEKLQAAVEAARKAVYATQESRDIPLSVCLEQAPAEIVAAYRAAMLHQSDWESDMVTAGRAYRDPWGRFTPY